MSEFNLSLIVPTFNQERFIKESLLSVFNQECPPTEILISDDASTDSTFEIIQECVAGYSGPHKIQAWQNKKNLGSGNTLKCAQKASLRRVVQFHGDDISRPDRARRLYEVFEKTSASLISTNATCIDEVGRKHGHLVAGATSGFDPLEEVVRGWQDTRTGSTQAFDVSIVKSFMPWSKKNYWAAGDHVLPFRATLLSGAYYLDEDLLFRRKHHHNLTQEVARRRELKPLRRELKLAHYLAIRAFMLRDLEYFISKEGSSQRTKQAQQVLAIELPRLVLEWSEMRSTLLNSGLRPSWISREQLIDDGFTTSSHLKSVLQEPPKRSLSRMFKRVSKGLKMKFGN